MARRWSPSRRSGRGIFRTPSRVQWIRPRYAPRVVTAAATNAAAGNAAGTGAAYDATATVVSIASALTDSFTTKDTAKWNYSGTADAVGGQLVAEALDSYTNHVQSVAAYNLTGSYASAKFVSTPALGNGSTEMYLQLSYVAGDNSNSLVFDIVGADLVAKYKVAGTPTFPFSTTYNSTTHRWLRIRESGGTTFWDYSPDGLNWTNAYSVANPITPTALHAELGTGYFDVETSPGNAVFDNFNIAPTVGSAENAAGTGTASSATPNVGPAAGNAAGTGTANTPSTSVASPAGNAAGTGTASSATPNVGPATGNAAGTGAAHNATAKVSPGAGNAAGTGAVRDAYDPQFEWSGYTWSKRVATGQGPGPNDWGATAANIRLDSNGYLVLEAQQVDGVWTCAEVDRVGTNLGYGRYQWVYDIDVANLDPKPVLGLFVYDQDAGSAPSQREIDIEVSKWGDDAETSTMSYAVHPVGDGEWLGDVHAQSTTGPYTAHFIWEPGQVYFRTTDANGTLLGEHVVTEGVQVPGTEQPIMNLWLLGGAAPEDGLPITATIHSFAFTASTTHTLAPAAAFIGTFDDPYEWATKNGASITGGELVLPCTSSYSYAYSGSVLDLRSSSTRIEISQVPATGGNGSHETLWYLRYDDDNYLAIYIGGGNLVGRMRQAGTNTDSSFGVHNATTHRYWRIGVSGTTATFATSADGSSWTTQWAPTTTLTSQHLKTLRMRLECGHYLSETAPGELHVTAYGAALTEASAGNAAGTGSAGAATASVAPSAGNAAGTASAGAPAPNVAPSAGNAAGTGTAYDPSVSATGATTAQAENAAGTGAAGAATSSVAPSAGNAAGTGSAGAVAPNVAPSAENAAGTGAAGAATSSVAPSAGNAAGTGSAGAPAPSVAPSAGNAAGTGAAGVGTTNTAAAGTEAATGTGSAGAATPNVGARAENAAGTGAALAPSASIASSAENAAGTGTAYGPSVSVTGAANAQAENAAGTGSAYGPSVNITAAGTGAATGTGSAGAAVPNVSPNAGAATGTGSAGTGTTNTAAAGTGLASGTGSAGAAAPSIAPNAGATTGTGAAGSATSSVAPSAGNASGTGTALASSPNVAPNAGHASGTGAALAPSASIAPNAGNAAGTGSAGAATPNVGARAENAAGTSTVFAPSTSIAPNAGAAVGTGSAGSPSPSVAFSAGNAAGTGAANASSPNVGGRAGNAAGTGTAGSGTTDVITGGAETATGSGSAGDAVGRITVYAFAGHASGSATASDLAALVAPLAGVAGGDGAALVGSVPIQNTAATAYVVPGPGTRLAYATAGSAAPAAYVTAGSGARPAYATGG